MSKYPQPIPAAFRAISPKHSNEGGSVLVYLVVVILIFGILGAAMVSLFTTATTSSATPNDFRRACFMADSATRYAFSELRDNDFDAATFNALNSTTYNLTDAGTFSLRAFSLWFESSSIQNSSPYTLNIPKGTLPLDFIVPANRNVWIINFEYLENTDDTRTRSPISAYTRVDNTTLSINLSGDFNISTNERVSLGVMPAMTQGPLAAGADLYVERVAKDFFPRFNGAVNINRVDYSYERLVDEPANNRVRLENLTAFRFNNPAGEFPLTVTRTTGGTYTGDFIALSPMNYTVIPTGLSESATCGVDFESNMNIYDSTPPPPRPDIDADEFTSNLRENETSSSFISVDTAADTLNIGGGVAAGANAEFGVGWYNADKSIGGNNVICQAGECEFRRGIRVFFILKFLNGQQGDGFTFTLMNAEGNDVSSVGGDIELSELMGYAGDSRLDAVGTSFLDGAGEGLEPPKLAVEFDTRTNFDAIFESEPEPKDFCLDLSELKPNTRNDPLSGNRDAVQYVFWGDRNFLIPCRGNNATYDDNRHDAAVDPITDPKNYKDNTITDPDGRFLVAVNNEPEAIEPDLINPLSPGAENDWLNSGPWAIRIEVMRNTLETNEGEYILRTWIRQCEFEDCRNIIGTFFEYTRVEFNINEISPHLVQTFALDSTDNTQFDTFIFGFTSAIASGALQSAVIENFQLSFIRPGDPVEPP